MAEKNKGVLDSLNDAVSPDGSRIRPAEDASGKTDTPAVVAKRGTGAPANPGEIAKRRDALRKWIGGCV